MTKRSLGWMVAVVMLLTVPAGKAPCTAGSPVPSAATDTVERIETHYRDLIDLTATVVQKNYLRTIDKTQTFEGMLSIRRPGQLRLEYTNGQVIVIDGKEAWFYSRKSEQAIRRTFKDFEQANIPVAFLLGAADIRQEFLVSFPDATKPLLLELMPRKSGAAMRKVRILADREGRIVQMTVFDRTGNTSEVTFSGIREGVGLEEDLFRFKVPKGTEIIEQ